jgi:two-component sensor histidine kinase
VRGPERKGFGSRLIAQAVASDLDGTYEGTFDPAGFSCRITMPLPPAGDGESDGRAAAGD